MIALLAHWRLAAAAAATIAVALLLLLLQHERYARAQAERGFAAARAEAASARAQASLETAAGTAAAAAERRTVHVVTRSEEAAHAILDLPGAGQALADPVRDAWVSAVRGLREPAAGAVDAERPGG
jgi:hypothetical protein